MSDIILISQHAEELREAFADQHPALGLTALGLDAAPLMSFSNAPSFVLGAAIHEEEGVEPTPQEWASATERMNARDPNAHQLFVVYDDSRTTYGVSMPADDAVQLQALGLPAARLGREQTFARANASFELLTYDYWSWKKLYRAIERA